MEMDEKMPCSCEDGQKRRQEQEQRDKERLAWLIQEENKETDLLREKRRLKRRKDKNRPEIYDNSGAGIVDEIHVDDGAFINELFIHRDAVITKDNSSLSILRLSNPQCLEAHCPCYMLADVKCLGCDLFGV